MNESNPAPRKKYSQLTALMAVAGASFRGMLRSPSAIVFSIAFPLVFILVFGFIGGGNFSLKVTPLPGTDTTGHLFQALKNAPGIRIKHYSDTALLRKDLAAGRLDGALSITEEGQGVSRQVNLYTSAGQPQESRMLVMIVQALVDKANLQAAGVNRPAYSVHRQEVTGRKYRMIDFILPGQLGFSLLSTGVFGTAFVFFNLRQLLVLKRFFATPISRVNIVLGEALARMVFSLLGAAIIIAIGRYAFHFTLIHGFITAFNMLLLSALGLVVFMGFGFVVSGLVNNESSIPPFANMITLPQFLLAGTFFPINNFPTWLQPISKILPLTYLNDALRDIAFEGAGLQDVWKEILILVAYGIGTYIIAARVFRWE